MSSLLVLPHRPHQLLRSAWHQIRLLKQNNAAHVHTTQNNSLSPQNENSNEPKFETLGLHPPIVAALQKAFPHIKGPTAAQEKFIPAILGDKDVLLKDATGTGKYVTNSTYILCRNLTVSCFNSLQVFWATRGIVKQASNTNSRPTG